MKSYLQTVIDCSTEYSIPLSKAFQRAQIPTSTYYRTINGATELRYETAAKVFNAIEELHSIQQARDYTQRLRETNQNVNRRSVRARFKPRIASL